MNKKISIILLTALLTVMLIGAISVKAAHGVCMLRIYPNDNLVEVHWITDESTFPTVTMTADDGAPVQAQFSEESGRSVRIAYPQSSACVKVTAELEGETILDKTIYVNNLPQISVTVNETNTKAYVAFSNVKMPTVVSIYNGLEFITNTINSSGSTYVALWDTLTEPYVLIHYASDIDVYYTSRKGTIGLKPMISFNSDYSEVHTTESVFTMSGLLINSRSLKINGYNVPLTDNGHFEYPVQLTDGENIFEYEYVNEDNISHFTARIYKDQETPEQSEAANNEGNAESTKGTVLFIVSIVIVASMGVWAVRKYIVKRG